jgi:hypothetical protein
LRAGIQTNRQKEARHGLKLMNAAAKQGSIGLEKNKMTASRDGTHQMRNSRMFQRLASADPNDGRASRNYFVNLFVRNRMAGIVMQNFCRIHKLRRALVRDKPQCSYKPGSGEVRCKAQGKPQHAL